MRVRVRFVGRVQGVGFRVTTQHFARSSGATGWIRNEPDGAVLAEFQGPDERVEGVLAQVRERFQGHLRGEDGSKVAEIDGEHDFEVRR